MTGRESGRSSDEERTEAARKLFIGIARAFGGAIFFALPLLMTMEMWWLGFYMDRFRLVLLLTLFFPLLVALDHYSGFKETSSWAEDTLDALIAYGVGFMASVAVLLLFDVVDFDLPLREIVGKVAVQAVPASLGAVLANSQLGASDSEDHEQQEEQRKREAGYSGELLFITAGALFFAFNVAPTEEMILIAFKMSAWHALALAVTTMLLMHAFVYGVQFRGAHSVPEGTPHWSVFARFTVVGYVVALLVSAYALWTFGRFEGTTMAMMLRQAVVLGFPAGLGAGAARLIL